MAEKANITKVPQKDRYVFDHDWSNPIRLQPRELQYLIVKVSDYMGVKYFLNEKITSGRSGAALYVMGCLSGDRIFVRVTSLTRARREKYVFDNLSWTVPTSPGGIGMVLVSLPEIKRKFVVAATVTKYIAGENEISRKEVCRTFPCLFEGPLITDAAVLPSNYRRALIKLSDSGAIDRSILRRLLYRGSEEPWVAVLGHGDPSISNVLRFDGQIIPVDYAAGGYTIRRLQKSRWIHSVHKTDGFGRLCEYCFEDSSDRLSLILDAVRRLVSDWNSVVYRTFWARRIYSLIGDKIDFS
ncbi:hypothetical protein M0E84_03330 [Corynebacterium sp. CCM 9186]|uniref:hypothetical protein n=1 Tax=Corynebacterium meridianum TaxID=2765363 RepID=UPI002003C826|nr:hypothetical protein [Corynebacterium meridianum]MCK7677074.1 hypothetical protein [Corynebacterium meridianum]